ncbi:inorganic phosphate transporter [Gluconobacter sphaericus]|nr:inorganic phosphate transporter [Gluconobacter sphaericus]
MLPSTLVKMPNHQTTGLDNQIPRPDMSGGNKPLYVALFFIVLAFKLVNSSHDTANTVATVIYTRSLPPLVAVIWSGFWNCFGVALSTGAVAYNIVTIMPAERIPGQPTKRSLASHDR